MIKKHYLRVITTILATLPVAASAELDVSSTFTCASVDVMECLPVQGCNRVSADAVDIPRFIKVDVNNKQITTGSAGDPRITAIERVEEIDGKLMLQGAEDGSENQRDGVGWTL